MPLISATSPTKIFTEAVTQRCSLKNIFSGKFTGKNLRWTFCFNKVVDLMLKTANYFRKVLHLRYLSGFQIYICCYSKIHLIVVISIHRRCSIRKGVLRNFQNPQENNCARVSFLIIFINVLIILPLACNFI